MLVAKLNFFFYFERSNHRTAMVTRKDRWERPLVFSMHRPHHREHGLKCALSTVYRLSIQKPLRLNVNGHAAAGPYPPAMGLV
jgi:hypothetical protein